MPATAQRAWVQVWDPLVRCGHWALVAAFAAAYLSAEDDSGGPGQIHVWSGYAVGVIVAVRFLWGVVGTRHARFSDFACSPMAALRYLADISRGHARRYLGHSPAAAAMVAMLLVCLATTVGTGLIAYGESGKGPLANAGGVIATRAHAEEREDHAVRGGGNEREGSESFAGDLHGTLANVTLGLVMLHILGVGMTSIVHRENLVGAMFSGRKRSGDEDQATLNDK